MGIDPSPGMIAVAPACGRLTFQVGAAETMTFVDEFDLVVSFNALHWVRDQAEALTRIATALRAQGRAVLVLVCGGPRPSLEDVATTVTGSPRWRSSFAGFAPPFVHPDPLAWQHVAALAGFAVDEVRVDDLSWDFGTREAFTAWCAVGFSGWTHRLSDEDGPTFVEQVVDAYAETAGSDHVFRFMQLVGRLTKPS